MNLPAFIFACPATLALIVRAVVVGDLPRLSFHAAGDAFEAGAVGSYAPSEEVEEWMRANWSGFFVGDPSPQEGNRSEAESVKLELFIPSTLEELEVARAWPRPWMPKLILAYREAGAIMTNACHAVGKSDEAVRLWRKRDATFHAALESIQREVDDEARAVIRNHAIEGVEEPVIGSIGDYRDGQLKGPDGQPLFIRKFDHRLLIRYAEARLPEYSRRNTEGGSTTVNVNASASASAIAVAVTVSPEKLADLQARNHKQLQKQLERAGRAAAGKN